FIFFFFQAEDGIRDKLVTGVQTCALPICTRRCITKSCTIRSGSGPSQISWDSSTRNSTARSSPDAAEFTRAVLTASFLSNGDNPPLTGTDSARTTRADRHADCLVKRKPMKHYDEQRQPVD